LAGDPNLSEARREPSGAFVTTPTAGLDPDDLWDWLSWYTRGRIAVPIVLVPGGYAVHVVLHTPFDLMALLWISLMTLPITIVSTMLLRRWKDNTAAHSVALERLVTVQMMWDTGFTALAVRYAGGPIGPFWPFPFVPPILATAVVPSRRMFMLIGGFALAMTALFARPWTVDALVPPLVLGAMFVSFAAFMNTAISNRVISQRLQRRELDHLRAEKTLAEAVARRREEILGVVSHELASPLTALRGYVRLLQEDKTRDERGAHLLERVDRQVARLSSLADDLLAMASTDAGTLQLKRSQMDIVGGLRELVEATRLQYPEATLALEGEPQVIGVWDRDRLDQLFSNLVANAMKFAGAKCRLSITVTRKETEVEIDVTDDGPGISADALRRIFEPFQRYSAERGGLGLGLAIAQTMVDLHGGRIWATSPNGRGATFHVVLPTDTRPTGEHRLRAATPTGTAMAGDR
jgi:signal transduction histidine kinase